MICWCIAALWILASTSVVESQWRGPVVVEWVTHEEVLRRCGYRDPRVMGCTFGGAANFGGMRGPKCRIVLHYQRPQYLEHELRHCTGWNH